MRRNAIRADRQLAPLVLVSKITQCGLGQAYGGPADYPIFSERSGHGLNRAYSRAASLGHAHNLAVVIGVVLEIFWLANCAKNGKPYESGGRGMGMLRLVADDS